jgi:hypothetical protein
MIDEIQRQEFWVNNNTQSTLNKKNMTALINKLYYTNNETILCIKGWINYNGEIFESDSDLLKIDLSSEDPIWSLCINDTCNQIVEDQGFKDLVCEGITDYIKNKQVMLSKIKK